MANFDLDAVVYALADAISSVSSLGRSAVFGACGEAMLPLLEEVERLTLRRWTFPEARPALDVVFDFVTGNIESAERADLRGSLMRSGPHGNELDSPWSTYAQDAITCIDAALVAASGDVEEFQPKWIQFALEPLVVSLAARGYDVDFEPVPPGGNSLQMELDAAVDFLRSALAWAKRVRSCNAAEYQNLIRSARVLVPRLD